MSPSHHPLRSVRRGRAGDDALSEPRALRLARAAAAKVAEVDGGEPDAQLELMLDELATSLHGAGRLRYLETMPDSQSRQLLARTVVYLCEQLDDEARAPVQIALMLWERLCTRPQDVSLDAVVLVDRACGWHWRTDTVPAEVLAWLRERGLGSILVPRT